MSFTSNHSLLKKLLLAFILTATSLTLRADILVNGDFSNGRASWAGDAAPESSSSLIINLDEKHWTKVSQTFNTHENELNFSVTFQLSPGGEFSKGKSKINGEVSHIIGRKLKKGHPLTLPKNSWVLILADYAKELVTTVAIPSKSGVTDAQTVTGTIPRLEAHEEKTLFLAFPPGHGTVTLSNISLTPTHP
jgi:hypothetical protein